MENTKKVYSNTGEVGTATMASVTRNRDERTLPIDRTRRNEGTDLNLNGRSRTDVTRLKTTKRTLRIATWDVRTLYKIGKLTNLTKEME